MSTIWVIVFVCSVIAFLVWGIREGWRLEPDAPLRRKLLNTKAAPWGSVTWLLFGLVLVSMLTATLVR